MFKRKKNALVFNNDSISNKYSYTADAVEKAIGVVVSAKNEQIATAKEELRSILRAIGDRDRKKNWTVSCDNFEIVIYSERNDGAAFYNNNGELVAEIKKMHNGTIETYGAPYEDAV